MSLNESLFNATNGKKFTVAAVAAVLVLVIMAVANTVSAADPAYITGLVYIDENQNGVWDAGESGYEGVYDVREVGTDRWEWANYGTEVSFTAAGGDPEDDGTTLLTAGLALPDEDGEVEICTTQSYEESLDDGTVALRPCEGTFGFIVFADFESWWDVSLTVPAGYQSTTPTDVTVGIIDNESVVVDFGIVPVE